MKVTMLISVSSVDGSYACGADYDLPEVLAKQWIKAGYAEAAEADEQPEPAPEAPAPVAPAPKPRARRGTAPKSELL